AVLFLDLDRFKVVNEHLGQHAGDRFIKGFAELLREAADASSVVTHYAPPTTRASVSYRL
ncbi:diguanylate cyclase domain-containing protein, partial [Mycobacterium sp.]|uniref:diguanylate cyclase domain-containing protein n=1 Tax=Mycobacterium sp. TaxID=1785 RepID=UPI003F97E881